jgi:tRNA A-37 threonylcarbamoyl transferase component Bud32
MNLATISVLLRQWSEHFDQGRDLSAGELCPDDPALAEELRPAIEMLRSLHQRVQAANGEAPQPPAGSQTTQGLIPPPSDLESRRISSPPGYEVLAEIGRGGMGVVYRAHQQHLNRIVALKMVLAGSHASSEERVRFLAEAEAAAGIQHPGIVQIHEFGTHEGTPYFALELCPGGSLAARLRAGPLPPREAARLIEQVARATQAAHDHGIVHRDLKPGNVLIDVHGQPKVADFGLARRLEGGHGLTQTGAVVGTPSYMAPEQASAKKEIGPAADVYALGAILYECLTGKPPFLAANSFDTILQVVNEDPIPPRQLNPQVPRDLENICLLCLEKQPERRYPSAAALGDDLGRFLAGDPVRARSLTRAERVVRWCRKRPAIAGLLAAVVTTLLLGSTVATIFGFRARAEAERARAFARDLDDKAKELEETLDQAEASLVAGSLQPLGHREGELGEAEIEALWRLAGMTNERIRIRFLDDMTRDESTARRVLSRGDHVARALAGTDEERAARLARHLLEKKRSADTSPKVKEACQALAVALAPTDAGIARETVPALLDALKAGDHALAQVARAEAIAQLLQALPAAERPAIAEATAPHVLRLFTEAGNPRTSCRMASALVRLSNSLDRERAGRLCLDAALRLLEVDAAVADSSEGELLAEAFGPLLERLPAREGPWFHTSVLTRLLRVLEVNFRFVGDRAGCAFMARSLLPLCRALPDKTWIHARETMQELPKGVSMSIRFTGVPRVGEAVGSPPPLVRTRRALAAWEWPLSQAGVSRDADPGIAQALAQTQILLALASSTSATLDLAPSSPHLRALLAGKGSSSRLASWRTLVAPLSDKDAERAMQRLDRLALFAGPDYEGGLRPPRQPLPWIQVETAILSFVLAERLHPADSFKLALLSCQAPPHSFVPLPVDRRTARAALATMIVKCEWLRSAAGPLGVVVFMADLLSLLPRFSPPEARRVAAYHLPLLIGQLQRANKQRVWSDIDLLMGLEEMAPWLSSRDREWALLRLLHRLEEEVRAEVRAILADMAHVMARHGKSPAVSNRAGALASRLLADLDKAGGKVPSRLALSILVRLLPALEPAEAAQISSRCLTEVARRKVGLQDDTARWLIDLFLLAQRQSGRQRQVFDQALAEHFLELRTDNLLDPSNVKPAARAAGKGDERWFLVRLATEMALLPPEEAALLSQWLIEAVLQDRPARTGTLAPWHVSGAVSYLKPAQFIPIWRKLDARLRAVKTAADLDNLLPLLRVMPSDQLPPEGLSCIDNLTNLFLATRDLRALARVATALDLLAECLPQDKARSLHLLAATTLLENWAGAPEPDRPFLEEVFAFHLAGLDNAGCGEILKVPFCVGGMERLLLAELSRRAKKRFTHPFEAVRWLAETGTPLHHDAPPKRGRALSPSTARARPDVWAEFQPAP